MGMPSMQSRDEKALSRARKAWYVTIDDGDRRRKDRQKANLPRLLDTQTILSRPVSDVGYLTGIP